METQEKTLLDAIVTMLTETYAGPPDPSGTWFIDNEANSGVFGIIQGLSAEQASRSVNGTGEPGSTIAGNVEHLRWSLALANAVLRGEDFSLNWKESWGVRSTDQEGWERLQRTLREEYEAQRQALTNLTHLPEGDDLTGILAMLPHGAFHLGLIRQMVERVR